MLGYQCIAAKYQLPFTEIQARIEKNRNTQLKRHWGGGGNKSTKPHLKLPKVQQPRELERTPTSKLNPRAEKIQGEGGSHGTEKLRK